MARSKIGKEEGVSEISLWDIVLTKVAKRFADKTFPRALSKEGERRYQALGEQAQALCDRIFDLLIQSERQKYSRELSIYREYVATDSVTLASIAPQYGVSRERIRQLVQRAEKHISRCFDRWAYSDDEIAKAHVILLSDLLRQMDYDAVSLVVYGWSSKNERWIQAMLLALFGAQLADAVWQASKPLLMEKTKWEQLLQYEQTLIGQWETFAQKIYYPASDKAAPTALVAPYEGRMLYSLESKLYNKLQRLAPVIDVVPVPDLVYYEDGRDVCRPSFLIRTPEGRSVLVLVLSTIRMASIYYVGLCNALHLFCAQNGYGYLIMDERGNSIYDLKQRELDPRLTQSLNSILQATGDIWWNDVKALKTTLAIRNEDIVAYVLQNRLRFTVKPFHICYR